MSKFYIPEGIGEDYKYVVPSGDYYDVYNTNYLEANRTYTYYRFYNSVDSDLYISREITTSNYNYGNLSCITVEPTHEYVYRKDYDKILSCSFIICVFIVILINIITSVVKKGGVFSGLI